MHIDVNFCLHFFRTHNTVSHAKTAQSTELSQHVKQTVCVIKLSNGLESNETEP